MARPSGRSSAILAGTFVALMVLSALPIDPGGGVVDPTPTPVTGLDLVVTEEHVTSGQEVWGDVIVQKGARIIVP